MANIKIFGNILSYATPSASGDLVPKWYVDVLADTPNKTTMTNIPSATFSPTYSGQVFYKNATTNVTLSPNVSNVTVNSGEYFEYFIVVKSNGKTVSFPSAWKWSGDSAPSTTTEGTYIIHVFTTDAKSKWRAELIGSYITPYNLKFTVQVTSSDKSIYFGNYGTINNIAPYTVNWGDGTTTTNSTDTYLDHTYASAGTYQVKIASTNGELPMFMFYDDPTKLLSVDYANVTWTGVDTMGSGVGMFQNCDNMTSIPSTLFSNNTNITSFSRCFYGCGHLTTIPEGLFSTNTSATDFSYCFYYCDGLESDAIPATIFPSSVTNVSYCFSHTSITPPANLFSGKTNITNFSYCFANTTFESIPATLFSNINTTNTNLDFSGCFSNNMLLTSIPSTLFNSITSTNRFATFKDCFSGCYGLTDTGNVPYVVPVWEFDNYYTTYKTNISTNPAPLSYSNLVNSNITTLIPVPYGGSVTGLDVTHTYTRGDFAYRELFDNTKLRYYLKVYVYVSSTNTMGSSLSDSSFDDTSIFVEGYTIPSGITASAKFYGYPAVGIFDLTFEDITINNINGGPTQWTYGTFNTLTNNGNISSNSGSGNYMLFYGCSCSLSGGVFTITFNGPMVSMYGSSYGISSGDQLVFTNFTETNGSPITATSTSAEISSGGGGGGGGFVIPTA